MSKNFYERNDYILNHEVNKKFEDLLWMSDTEFENWVVSMRAAVLHAWDNLGNPPRTGWSETGIVDQFSKMDSFPTHEFLTTDLLTNEENVLRNTSIIGNAANQWFPTMMATRIAYTKDLSKAKSIHDWFSDDTLIPRFLKYATRHFKRDGFYFWSRPVRLNNAEDFLFRTDSGPEWVKWFESNRRHYSVDDYWLVPKSLDSGYTGSAEDPEIHNELFIPKEMIDDLPIPDNCKTNIGDPDKTDGYQIRYYKYGHNVFPEGYKSFRVSFCQYAVNYPPLTAKYLYERYTEHIKDQDAINVYDPSMGWGGRILGAMSVKDDRNIHYIGTDPNTDHNLPDGRTKYHDLADFYNTRTNRATSLFPHTNTYEIFQHGSEEVGNDPAFQKYKGQLDMVFTSPPYFAKEIYSDDPAQSAHKFNAYDDWVEGFLRPTLETAVEYLRSDRYLLWNISDCKFDKDVLPLEEDSRDILDELGMEYVETMKMALNTMPGGNRVDEEGKPRTGHFVRVNRASGGEMFLKYEPVFVYRKK